MCWTYTKITPNRRYKCIERFTRRLCSISRLFRSFFEQFIYDFPSPREKRQTCGETSRHLGHGQTTTCSVPFESCVCHLGRTQKKPHKYTHVHIYIVGMCGFYLVITPPPPPRVYYWEALPITLRINTLFPTIFVFDLIFWCKKKIDLVVCYFG